MTLFDYYLQYMTQVWEGKRPAPEGITLPDSGDENARIQALGRQLQAMGMAGFVRACAAMMDHALLRLAEEGRLDVVAALLSGDRKTFEALRCEAPELVHAPVATYDWYVQHYLDRDYPIRLIMRLNGVKFPD